MPQRPPVDAPTIPVSLESALHFLAAKRLSTALLLLASGHRPFLFLSGQLLQVSKPFFALWTDSSGVDEWVSFLSHPNADRSLNRFLELDREEDTFDRTHPYPTDESAKR